MDLVLIGLRGSGKSTLGERLAQRHKLRFVDLDVRTPAEFGVRSVAEAWATYGEAAFREAEVRALGRAIAEDPDILALGGGTPTAPGAEDMIRALRGPPGAPRSRVVYLRAPAEVLAARLEAGGVTDRPSLTGEDPIREIGAVLAFRDPLYRDLADDIVEVGALSEREALQALAVILQRD
jgi:shikimate kinase